MQQPTLTTHILTFPLFYTLHSPPIYNQLTKNCTNRYYDYKSEYGHDYGYGSEKLTLKLWEIKRGDIRPQPLNPNTFQFRCVFVFVHARVDEVRACTATAC